MPKRNSDEDSDEYIRRKMRKIEKKLQKRKSRARSRRLSSSSSEPEIATPLPSTPASPASPVLSLLEDGHEGHQEEIVTSIQQGTDNTLFTQNEVHNEPNPGPTSEAQDDTNLDEDILELLGESPSRNKKMGSKIPKELALRWEHLATKGLTKEARKELLEKHLLPENCPKVAPPILNPEIKAALTDVMYGKDKSTATKQNQITSALACLGECLTNMFNSNLKDPVIIKPLIEGAQLLCDLQYTESMKRRSFICASIKKDIKGQLYQTEIDTYLFGEKLSDTLKSAKAITKSGSEIKATKSKAPNSRPQSRFLNSKPPLVNSRQPAKRRQEPATYTQAMPPNQYQPFVAPQHHLSPYLLPPPPPPPPLPAQPPAQQQQPQRSKQRPYQRR